MGRTTKISFVLTRGRVALLTLIGGLFITLSGCELITSSGEGALQSRLEVPTGFPPIPSPEHNPITLEKVELGERLFTDPGLSRDGTLSCQSCHLPEHAFAENIPISIGVDGRPGIRNSPSLVNVAYQKLFFWDGGALSLENQVFGPLESPDEMDAKLDEVLAYLTSDESYVESFNQAFGRKPDLTGLTQALASFQRTIRSTGSSYDAFVEGRTSSLSPAQQRGLQLFEGKASCISCHSGFLLSDLSFRNNGLLNTAADSGRARITTLPEDAGKFKVPSLRNVDLTAPYMHDGRFQTLANVIDHYDAGGQGAPQTDTVIQPLKLTETEKSDLIAFLRSLTDNAIQTGLSGN